MLSKTQKIWAWIFAAMFVVPEVLWGNIIKILNLSFLPIYKDVVLFADNPALAYLIIIAEIIGIVGLIYTTVRHYNNSPLKYIILIVLIILLLVLIYSLLMSYTVNNIRLF